MRKTLLGRRAPRKIGPDEDEDASAPETAGSSESKRPSSKSRKPSNLRRSLGPSAFDHDEEADAAVVTPKHLVSSPRRMVVHQNASKRSSLLASQLPVRDEDDAERPSYSAASLQALKDSTPSTPRDIGSLGNADVEDVLSGTQALDLSSKFGSSLAHYQQPSAIPSAAEIAEKKARRARLAKEQQAEEYISLDPDDPNLDEDEDLDDNVMKDDNGRLVLKAKDKYGLSESRLVPDDEDIMEDFDDFTEDGKISLGRKAEAEAARRRKREMAAQIAQAEGESDSDSDENERERNAAYEASQTRHGTYAHNATTSDPADARPRTPPIITPLPTLGGVIQRLRTQLADMQSSRMQKLQEMENLQREKIRLAEEEVRIQRALKETAEKFELLRQERGIIGTKGATPAIDTLHGLGLNDARRVEQRSASDVRSTAESGDKQDEEEDTRDEEEEVEEEDDGEENGAAVHTGLGFSGAGRGAGAGLGFGPPTTGESEENTAL